MPSASTAPAAEKAKRKPKNPYTITPEEGFNFKDGKTVPFKGWRVTIATPRGQQPVSVILYDENLTHELLNSVISSHDAANGGSSS